MGDFNNKEFYERIDYLIRYKATGNPKEFAEKLEISESQLYRIIKKLKYDAGCPIEFCKYQNSYYYKVEGQLIVEFCFEQMNNTDLSKIIGGKFNIFILDSQKMRVN